MQTRRVVITGLGQISPLGLDLETFWTSLIEGKSGIRPVTSLPADALPTPYMGECQDFTGGISDFGDVDKVQTRAIRKNLKVMCREIQMGVAAAQRALQSAGISPGSFEPDRAGVVFGSDYMMTIPDEFEKATRACLNEDGEFDFGRWPELGFPQVTPLWLLKYLPNMPASHIAIFNDMRGPNNSLTLRETSSNAAVGEGMMTIARGHADLIIAGSTGTRVHDTRTVHTILQEPVATHNADRCMPFDSERTGMILGEGAGAIILESLEHAEARGAKIYGEVIAQATSSAADSSRQADSGKALANAIQIALREADRRISDIGHFNTHGLGTEQSDITEAQAIHAAVGEASAEIPSVAMKSFFGNLGAGSGIVETIGSLLALQNGKLPATLDHQTTDPKCNLNISAESREIAKDGMFLNLSFNLQGQASAVVISGSPS